MNVLVTGGAGFIGSHVVDRLIARGDHVVVLDNLDPQVHADRDCPNLEDARARARTNGASSLRFVESDVRDPAAVHSVLEDIDTVVHLAATVGVGQSMYRPSYYTDTNVQGQGVLMEAMLGHRATIRKFVVASSMSIYGEGAYSCTCNDEIIFPTTTRTASDLGRRRFDFPCPRCGRPAVPVPTPESKTLHSTSIYALTKKQQEELALCFGAAYDMPTIALRFFNVYGSRQSLNNPYTGVAAIFMARLLNGEPPLIFEDGGQERDFVHVHDVAAAVLAAVDAPPEIAGPYNVATGTATSVGGVAQALARRLDRSEIAPRIMGSTRKGDIRSCVGDNTAIRRDLGWEPRIRFEDGLTELIEWSREQSAKDLTLDAQRELAEVGLVHG